MKKYINTLMVLLLAFSFIPKASAGRFHLCQVSDPTGTPLNVRVKPYGTIVTSLKNGKLLLPIFKERAYDKKGNAWVPVKDHLTGKYLGYVYEKYLFCWVEE